MTDKTKRRILKAGVSLLVLAGLAFAYHSYAATSRIEKVQQLATEMRNLPPEQRKGAQEKMRAAMKSLTPSERRQVFEKGEEKRLKDFFKLSDKDRVAYLDNMIKREMEWRANRNRNRTRATTKTASTKNASNRGGGNGNGNGNGNNGNGNNGRGGQGQGQGQGRQNMSPEQRAQARRTRLDQTSPEQRGMRAAFHSALASRRAQLGLPGGRGR